MAERGLSPLARGNRLSAVCVRCRCGPIPARAGQPRSARTPLPACRAYPRSRGATQGGCATTGCGPGLSPLARGNLGAHEDDVRACGPIPARAGQPTRGCPAAPKSGAYPRSRGATWRLADGEELPQGLSPLARGNRHLNNTTGNPIGTIPARAGQPFIVGISSSSSRAYPRSRGATRAEMIDRRSASGLSPLARGNRHHGPVDLGGPGPIPARAGQPGRASGRRPSQRAYPRSRGATSSKWTCFRLKMGLSPLARGNRTLTQYPGQHIGPIPARAGQPSRPTILMRRTWAYPRSRGATSRSCDRLEFGEGLSPLARGNLEDPDRMRAVVGPIPARAGQPSCQPSASAATRAYPRSRGATTYPAFQQDANEGLSPLARGNPRACRWRWRPQGPIPARAGQPSRRTRHGPSRRAYPRSRGATTSVSTSADCT